MVVTIPAPWFEAMFVVLLAASVVEKGDRHRKMLYPHLR